MMSADDNGIAPTGEVPDEIAAAREASGVTPEAARLGAMLVEHVRKGRHMIDEWQRANPTIADYRVCDARRALRLAEFQLSKLVTGDDADLRQAKAAYQAAFPDEEHADTPQQAPAGARTE